MRFAAELKQIADGLRVNRFDPTLLAQFRALVQRMSAAERYALRETLVTMLKGER